jgi:hypothetical protein
MSNIELGNEPIFKKEHLKNYLVVKEPGTYLVPSHSNVKPSYVISEGNKSRYLIYLKCSTFEKLKECSDIIGYKEVIPFNAVKHCFMKGILWKNNVKDTLDLPTRNEKVIATFENVEGKLVCTNITLIPRRNLEEFNLYDVCESRNIIKKLLEND